MTTGLRLETIWNVDTRQGHSLRIMHRDVPVEDVADACTKQTLIGRIVLHPDGSLVHHSPDGRMIRVDADDVVVERFTRPFETRGESFVPDRSGHEGRARIEATMTDPRYQAGDADYMTVGMSLAELAAMPGSTGSLQSIAFDVRRIVDGRTAENDTAETSGLTTADPHPTTTT